VFAGAGDDQIDLWKNREAYPRGFMVYRAEVAPDEAAAARRVADPQFRPDRVAVVERPVPGVPPPTAGEPLPAWTPIFGAYRTTSLDLAVEVVAARPGVLVLGEVYYPSWKVLVDGQPAELLRVDYALRGVALGPGPHVVAMAVEDQPLARGGAISLTALALLSGLLLYERRRRSSAPTGRK
jgi:hypothetical protein